MALVRAKSLLVRNLNSQFLICDVNIEAPMLYHA